MELEKLAGNVDNVDNVDNVGWTRKVSIGHKVDRYHRPPTIRPLRYGYATTSAA